MTQFKQTTVEWLIEQLGEYFPHEIGGIHLMVEQAKEMEKEHQKECWNVAHQAGRFEGKGIAQENWQTFEQYYSETYGKTN